MRFVRHNLANATVSQWWISTASDRAQEPHKQKTGAAGQYPAAPVEKVCKAPSRPYFLPLSACHLSRLILRSLVRIGNGHTRPSVMAASVNET